MSESAGDVGFVLLAAGASVRMGRPKQLLDVGGQPMVRYVARQALAAGCRPVIVVTGAHASEVRRVMAHEPVECVVNHAWEVGMGTSIACGVRALAAREDVCGVVLGLVDQPLVAPSVIESLAARVRDGATVVASRYAGTLGVPAGFGRSMFDALLALQGREGARQLIRDYGAEVEWLDCPEAGVDIDFPADYLALSDRASEDRRRGRPA